MTRPFFLSLWGGLTGLIFLAYVGAGLYCVGGAWGEETDRAAKRRALRERTAGLREARWAYTAREAPEIRRRREKEDLALQDEWKKKREAEKRREEERRRLAFVAERDRALAAERLRLAAIGEELAMAGQTQLTERREATRNEQKLAEFGKLGRKNGLTPEQLATAGDLYRGRSFHAVEGAKTALAKTIDRAVKVACSRVREQSEALTLDSRDKLAERIQRFGQDEESGIRAAAQKALREALTDFDQADQDARTELTRPQVGKVLILVLVTDRLKVQEESVRKQLKKLLDDEKVRRQWGAIAIRLITPKGPQVWAGDGPLVDPERGTFAEENFKDTFRAGFDARGQLPREIRQGLRTLIIWPSEFTPNAPEVPNRDKIEVPTDSKDIHLIWLGPVLPQQKMNLWFHGKVVSVPDPEDLVKSVLNLLRK